MIRTLLLSIFSLLTFNITTAQQPALKQYFDGADTNAIYSIIINIDSTDSNNIWQIGPPQKTVFDTPATTPNVIVTDTINTYPPNDTSMFYYGVNVGQSGLWSIIAIRWKQMLDIDSAMDGGIVEYSIDSGQSWINIHTDTNVYNFYGFDTTNVSYLPDSTLAFTGTDSIWRDIWLCYDYNYFLSNNYDSLIVRYTFRSDSVDNARDGWMIDNMFLQETFFHTVSTVDPESLFNVYPTLTTGVVKIDIAGEAKQIHNIIVTDGQGKILKRYNQINDTKAQLELSGLPDGSYYLSIHTDKKIEVHKVIVVH